MAELAWRGWCGKTDWARLMVVKMTWGVWLGESGVMSLEWWAWRGIDGVVRLTW